MKQCSEILRIFLFFELDKLLVCSVLTQSTDKIASDKTHFQRVPVYIWLISGGIQFITYLLLYCSVLHLTLLFYVTLAIQ